jgi:hypothetical protein
MEPSVSYPAALIGYAYKILGTIRMLRALQRQLLYLDELLL